MAKVVRNSGTEGQRPDSGITVLKPVTVSVSTAEEQQRAARVLVEEDEKRLSLPGSKYSAIRNAEKNVVDKYQFIFDAIRSLSPEARYQIKQLLLDREMKISDSVAAMAKMGIRLDSAEGKRWLDTLNRELEDSLAPLCGDQFTEFQRLRGMTRQMFFIDRFMLPETEYSGAPLSNEQRLQLAAVMKEVHLDPGGPDYAAQLRQTVDPSTGLLPVYRELIARSSGFLLPQQVQAIKAAQDYSLAAVQRRAPAADGGGR